MVSAAIEETEVLIVGAGAAGTLVAAKLAEAGRKVVVLEAGAPWRVEDMVSSQLWARRLKGTPGVTSVGGNPVSAAFNTGAGFGGSAIHYYASSIRLQPEDFKVRSIYGRSADWPFDYDALRPYYDKVQREIGISGDAAAEKWRPEGEPYPMPPLLQQTQADVITRGFQAKGLALSPTPTAINSEEYNGRGACLYDGWCDAGCPIVVCLEKIGPILERAREGIRIGEIYGTSAIYAGADHREAA
jgi:choline dehydrogenase-like flavoprotein